MTEKRMIHVTHGDELPAGGDALDWAMAIYHALSAEQRFEVREYLRHHAIIASTSTGAEK